VKSKTAMVWLVAMLVAMVIALCPVRSRGSVDAVRLGVVVEEHPPKLATTIEVLEEGDSIQPRGALVEVGGQQVEPVQRPRVRPVRRTARGPPRGRRRRCASTKNLIRREKTC
jgi:hypothetical protein